MLIEATNNQYLSLGVVQGSKHCNGILLIVVPYCKITLQSNNPLTIPLAEKHQLRVFYNLIMPQTSQSCHEWPRNTQERPRKAENGREWHRMAQNGPERLRKAQDVLEHLEVELSIIERLKTSHNGLRMSILFWPPVAKKTIYPHRVITL